MKKTEFPKPPKGASLIMIQIREIRQESFKKNNPGRNWQHKTAREYHAIRMHYGPDIFEQNSVYKNFAADLPRDLTKSVFREYDQAARLLSNIGRSL